MQPPPAIVAAEVAQPQAQHFALELTAAPSRFRPLPPPLRRRSYQATLWCRTQPLLSSRTRLCRTRSGLRVHTTSGTSRFNASCRERAALKSATSGTLRATSMRASILTRFHSLRSEEHTSEL